MFKIFVIRCFRKLEDGQVRINVIGNYHLRVRGLGKLGNWFRILGFRIRDVVRERKNKIIVQVGPILKLVGLGFRIRGVIKVRSSGDLGTA